MRVDRTRQAVRFNEMHTQQQNYLIINTRAIFTSVHGCAKRGTRFRNRWTASPILLLFRSVLGAYFVRPTSGSVYGNTKRAAITARNINGSSVVGGETCYCTTFCL